MDSTIMKEMRVFLERNPDLRAEMEEFEQVYLPADTILFSEKEQLKKNVAHLEDTDERYFDHLFIAKLEGDLSPDEEKALGVKYVKVVDPYDYAATKEVLTEAVNLDEPAVVITKRACPLYDRSQWEKPFWVNEDECIGCKTCVRLGCPAISFKAEEKKAYITPVLCTGCSICSQVCPKGAIHAAEDN